MLPESACLTTIPTDFGSLNICFPAYQLCDLGQVTLPVSFLICQMGLNIYIYIYYLEHVEQLLAHSKYCKNVRYYNVYKDLFLEHSSPCSLHRWLSCHSNLILNVILKGPPKIALYSLPLLCYSLSFHYEEPYFLQGTSTA